MPLSRLLAIVIGTALVLAEIVLRVMTAGGSFQGFPLLPLDPPQVVTKAPLVADRDQGWSLPLTAPVTAPVLALTYGGTYADALAKRIGKVVLDAGVPGHSVDQAIFRYRSQKGIQASECVLIGFSPDDIARHVNRYPPYRSPADGVPFAKPRFKLAGASLELIPVANLDQLAADDLCYRPEYYEKRPLDRWRTARVYRTIAARHETQQVWRALYERQDAVELTARILSAFAAEVANDGRRPLIVVLPDAGPTRLHEVVTGPLAKARVPLVDVSGATPENAVESIAKALGF